MRGDDRRPCPNSQQPHRRRQFTGFGLRPAARSHQSWEFDGTHHERGLPRSGIRHRPRHMGLCLPHKSRPLCRHPSPHSHQKSTAFRPLRYLSEIRIHLVRSAFHTDEKQRMGDHFHPEDKIPAGRKSRIMDAMLPAPNRRQSKRHRTAFHPSG